MIDWSRIEGFEWDEGNARKSEAKHGISSSEAEQVFVDERLTMARDVAHSGDEERLHAFGRTFACRLLQVSFTLRGGGRLIRVISARPMSNSERRRYAEEG
jgi:uncharacterized DUF497 family protein